MKPLKTAVIGCGAISDIYLENMTRRFSTLDVVCCCANHRENAEKKAKQYGKGYTGLLSRLLDAAIDDEELVRKCI